MSLIVPRKLLFYFRNVLFLAVMLLQCSKAYDYNYTWQADTGPGENNWSRLASSATGQYIAITCQSSGKGGIWYSADYGNSFVESNSGQYSWYQISMSSNGQNMVAGINSGSNSVVYSLNGGASWSSSSFAGNVFGLASDDSGQYVTLGTCPGYLYYSSNYGQSFTQASGSAVTYNCWQGVAISANGSKQVAVSNDGGIILSTNYGASWVSTSTSYTSTIFLSVASDSTGQYLAAAAMQAGVYYSTNGGQTWTFTSISGPYNPSIVSSYSGDLLAMAAQGMGILISTDHGATWFVSTDSQSPTWGAVAMNSNGTNLMAVTTSLSYPYWYVSPPTMAPTAVPTPISTDSTALVNLQLVCACIPGIALFLVRLLSLYTRRVVNISVNQLHSTFVELGESLLSSVNVIVALTTLLYAYGHNGNFSFIFLMVSRLLIVVFAVVFNCVYFAPIDHRTASSSKTLSLMMNRAAVSEGISVKLCGVSLGSIPMRSVTAVIFVLSIFDLTVLRVLPWTRSKFTTNVQGYPNIFTVRLCMGGTLLSMLLQTTSSSIALLTSNASNHENWEYLFMLFSCLNLLIAVASVLLLLQSAHMLHLDSAGEGNEDAQDKKRDSTHVEDDDVEMNKSVVSRLASVYSKHDDDNDDGGDMDKDHSDHVVIMTAVACPVVENDSWPQVVEAVVQPNVTKTVPPDSVSVSQSEMYSDSVRNVLHYSQTDNAL